MSPFFGQAQMTFDTLNLMEVEILSHKIDKTAGFKVVTVDSSTRESHLTKNLAELMTSSGSVFVKSYGQGSLATTSFRGASAAHTQVLWNGVNINSPMPGQSDFSQIPVYFVDRVKLFYGAGSISQTNGGLGGSISLDNEITWNNTLDIQVLQEVASFETFRTFATVGVGNRRFQSSTRVLSASAKNDFKFLNNAVNRENPPIETRKDASFNQKGFLQEFSLKTGNHGMLSARLWAQENFREIPPNIMANAPEGNEKLNESFVRGLLSFDYFKGSASFTLQTGMLHNDLNYQNKISLTDASNTVVSLVNSAKYQNQITNNFVLNAGMNFNHHEVNSENYDATKIRNEGSGYLGLNFSLKNKLYLNFIARQEITDGKIMPFTPSLGINYNLSKNDDLTIKFNVAKNFHTPTLNDLYWNPGGNENLQNETGYSAESGFSFKKQLKAVKFETGLTAFYSDIQNWIMWLPDSVYSYWSPSNLKNVISKGIEFEMKLSGKSGKVDWTYAFGYAFTSAVNKKALSENDLSVGKQLIYVPRNTLNNTLQLNYRNFSLTYSLNFAGIRYTTSDNSRYLPGYFVDDLRIAKRLKWGKSLFDLQFSINNLTAQNYQVIAWQPMPGRNYRFSLSYKFGK